MESSRMGTALSNSARPFLNRCLRFRQLLLPTQCVLCDADTVRLPLCDACAASLPRLPRARCRVCALPLASGDACGKCLERAPFYDSVSAAYAYAFPVDALVHAYKYRSHLTLAPLLAAQLARSASLPVDVIIPMPLTAARLRERGFNQAHELARHVGRALSVGVLARACRKIVDTPPQTGLAWSERVRNIRSAFVCDVELTGQRVAIVDDVMTTGATLNELARNLKRAGAAQVQGWVLARTLP